MIAPHCTRPASITITANIAACIGCLCVATVPSELRAPGLQAKALFRTLRYQRHYEPIAVIDNFRPRLIVGLIQVYPIAVRGAAGYSRSIKGAALLSRGSPHGC